MTKIISKPTKATVLIPIIRKVMPIAVARSIIGPQTPSLSSLFGEFVDHRNKIWQIDELQFQFYGIERDDIMDWLMYDCVWSYTCYSSTSESEKYRTIVRFEDIKGSVEFKLRFFGNQ